jgi:hypothetical protein
MDVKSAFLRGDLQEEIYMEKPPGYVHNDSSLVCHLKKFLYGLKQTPRAWYAKMDNFLIDIGFSRCHSNPNVYTKKVGSHLTILVLYVDDVILTGSGSKLLNHVKTSLKKKFEMTDLGFLHYFLGLQVLQTNEGIFFPSLSILVTFFVAFTSMIVNQLLLPSSLESILLLLVLLSKLMPPCTTS